MVQKRSPRARRCGSVLVGLVTGILLLPATPAMAATVSITAPTDGATLTAATVAVSATSDAEQVRFSVDGTGGAYDRTVAVSAGVAVDSAFPVAGLVGAHVLRAVNCVAGVCDATNGEDQVTVTVDSATPVITSPGNGTFVRSSVTVNATTDGGGLEYLVDGSRAAFVSGPPYSTVVPLRGFADGSRTLTVRRCDRSANVCDGPTSAPVTVTKDTTGPSWAPPRPVPSTVYPVRDGYRDVTRLLSSLSERATNVAVRIRAVGGRTVRVLPLGTVGPGRVSARWNGRSSRGRVVAAGRYSVTFRGSDLRGNVRSSATASVWVSDKQLVTRHVGRRVTALGSLVKVLSGTCSGVYRLSRQTPGPRLAKGIGLYSNSRCRAGNAASLASAFHGLRLPAAIRYGRVRVDVFGGQAARQGGAAVLAYVAPNGDLRAGRVLRTSLGWHAGRTTALRPLVAQRHLVWIVGTTSGRWYNFGGYRISYTYTVLR